MNKRAIALNLKQKMEKWLDTDDVVDALVAAFFSSLIEALKEVKPEDITQEFIFELIDQIFEEEHEIEE